MLQLISSKFRCEWFAGKLNFVITQMKLDLSSNWISKDDLLFLFHDYLLASGYCNVNIRDTWKTGASQCDDHRRNSCEYISWLINLNFLKTVTLRDMHGCINANFIKVLSFSTFTTSILLDTSNFLSIKSHTLLVQAQVPMSGENYQGVFSSLKNVHVSIQICVCVQVHK